MGGVPPRAALGRGLGTLLRNGKTDPAVDETPGETPATLSSGMATLLRGNNGNGAVSPCVPEAPDEETEIIPAPAAEAPLAATSPDALPRTRDPLDPDEVATRRLYQASLFVADIMLLVLSTWLVLIADKPLGLLSATAISLAVALGAWLACLAFWMDEPDV